LKLFITLEPPSQKKVTHHKVCKREQQPFSVVKVVKNKTNKTAAPPMDKTLEVLLVKGYISAIVNQALAVFSQP
jgi:hypothetical protein